MPRSALLFEAAETPSEAFGADDGREVIEVGDFDDDLRIFLEIDRGQVLFGLDRDTSPTFVNETLGDFISCLLKFDEGYPFCVRRRL